MSLRLCSQQRVALRPHRLAFGLVALALSQACGSEGSSEVTRASTPNPGQTEPSAEIEGEAEAPAPVRLPRSTPEAEGLSSSAVLELVDALDRRVDVHSMMLLRHGKVVAEGWWAPYAAEDIHAQYSVSKSFNATAVGFAEAEGLLSLDDRIVDHLGDHLPAELGERVSELRILHLLTMSTGHQRDTIDRIRQDPDDRWVRAFLSLDVENPPGSPFVYNSGASYVLSAIVQAVSGQSVAEYLATRLFRPLGIGGPEGEVVWGQSPEGVTLGSGGLSATTEDLAKFGQLYLDDGMWEGERVLPEGWAQAATQRQGPSEPGEGYWSAGYGYQFWRNVRELGYRADGAFGQFSLVVPQYDMVLAMTAGTSDLGPVHSVLWQYIRPAFEAATEGALEADPEALSALQRRLGSLRIAPAAGDMASETAERVSGARYALEDNPQGLQAVRVDWSAQPPSIELEDADGTHTIAFGMGAWERGRTGFYKGINGLFDRPEQGIAASGAWADDSTFRVSLCFHETPFILDLTLAFEGNAVELRQRYNERWGDLREAPIVGRMEP